MGTLDPAGQEFLRIAERYRRMSDEELLVLMPQSSELTPFAQEALANEVRSRGLKAEAEDEQPAASSQFKPSQAKPPSAFFEHVSPKFRDSAGSDFPGPDSPDSDSSQLDSSQEDQYDEDRKLVELCTVWSERDALQLQEILDEAGIPFSMGKENATGVDKVTSNFANGIGVQIMQIGIPWARQAMQHYEPEDDPTPKETPELDEVVIRCPQCHSDEVVFEGRTSELANARDESSQKFEWTCDSCGHRWEDDGVKKRNEPVGNRGLSRKNRPLGRVRRKGLSWKSRPLGRRSTQGALVEEPAFRPAFDARGTRGRAGLEAGVRRQTSEGFSPGGAASSPNRPLADESAVIFHSLASPARTGFIRIYSRCRSKSSSSRIR